MQVIDVGFDTGVLLVEVLGFDEVATSRFRKVMGLQVDVSPAPAFNVTDKQTSVPDQSNGLLTELPIFTVTVPEFAPLFPKNFADSPAAFISNCHCTEQNAVWDALFKFIISSAT